MSQKFWCFLGVHKFGKEENRKIVCQECGKVKIVPCIHNFEPEGERDIISSYTNNVTGHLFVDRCSKCGELRETRSYANN